MPWSSRPLSNVHKEETLMAEVSIQPVGHGDDIHHTVG